MRKTFLFLSLAFIASSCNNGGSTDANNADSSKKDGAKTEGLVYPYKLEKGYKDWQPGDQKHVVTVMNGLKAFENGDIKACLATFGDSVEVFFDGLRERMSNDSLGRFFTIQRAGYKSMRIDMQDWESVISKDGKEEWVTLWYKQVWTDLKGVTDSLAVIDDAKIEKGKAVVLDEKVQRYPKKK